MSVVVPVYNEAGNAVPLFTKIREVMTAIGRSFEIIFVNDGSTDATLTQLRAQAAVHQCLRILDLDGNFGEAAALSAGFQASRGALVVALDGDGQNDPHDIPRLLATLEHGGYRVVSGWRQQRQEGLLMRVLPSRLANGLIATISGVPLHDNGCGLKAYRRDVVAAAALPPGMHRFMPAIFGVAAAEVTEVRVRARRREHGQSHYDIRRTFAVLRDLLALRFLIGNAQRARKMWQRTSFLLLFCGMVAARKGSLVGVLVSVLALVVAVMIWWNLRRFNAGRSYGVFRLRREYSYAEGL